MAERVVTTTEEEELAITFAESRGSSFGSSVRALLADWIHARNLDANARTANIVDKLVHKQPLLQEEKTEMQSLLDAASVMKVDESEPVIKG